MEIKEYKEVLALAKGIVESAVRESADGYQLKDLMPIVSDNIAKSVAAYEGASAIPAEWKENSEECVLLTIEFAVDAVLDLLKMPAGAAVEFKETKELLDAGSGIANSVIAHLPGGIKALEILPIVFENINSIITGVTGVEKVIGEFNSDRRAFIKLVAVSAVKLAFEIKKAMSAQPKA